MQCNESFYDFIENCNRFFCYTSEKEGDETGQAGAIDIFDCN